MLRIKLIGYCFNQPLNSESIPVNVTCQRHLRPGIFQRSLKYVGVTHLTFGGSFNQPLNPEFVDYLIKTKANVNLLNNNGMPQLVFACRALSSFHVTKCVRILLDANADTKIITNNNTY